MSKIVFICITAKIIKIVWMEWGCGRVNLLMNVWILFVFITAIIVGMELIIEIVFFARIFVGARIVLDARI
jgi:hypothetical protein